MKYLFLFLSIFTISALATETVCTSWHQAGEIGSPIDKQKLTIVTSSALSIQYKNSHHGFDFEVEWDIDLTSFNISISNTGKDNRFFFTQARVPTTNHPENFTDITLQDGIRLSVNCELK